MAMIVHCPDCGGTVEVPSNPVDELLICPSCGQEIPAEVEAVDEPLPARTSSPPRRDRGTAPRTGIRPGSTSPLPATPGAKKPPPSAPPKSGSVPVAGPGGPSPRKTKAPSRTGATAGQPPHAGVPLLDTMVHPVRAGARRWVTLTCLIAGVVILVASVALVARQRLTQKAPRPPQPRTARPLEPPGPFVLQAGERGRQL
jgi:hypothetical protein